MGVTLGLIVLAAIVLVLITATRYRKKDRPAGSLDPQSGPPERATDLRGG